MTITATITQTGPRFVLDWVPASDEAVEVRRLVPLQAGILATVASGTVTYTDLLDTPEPGDTVTYSFTGVTSADTVSVDAVTVAKPIPPLDDDRRYEAALLVAARLWKRRDAPFGVAGGGDMGSIQIGFKDPDVELILMGLRRTDSDLSTQVWPDVDAFRSRIQAQAAHTDATLTIVLDAAISVVTRKCKGAGIA